MPVAETRTRSRRIVASVLTGPPHVALAGNPGRTRTRALTHLVDETTTIDAREWSGR